MFGVTFRAIGSAVFGVFAVAIMARVLNPLVDVMNAPNSMLVNSFSQITEHTPAIVVLSCVLMFVAAGAARSSRGGF